jgi:hypothetical protein
LVLSRSRSRRSTTAAVSSGVTTVFIAKVAGVL